MGHYTKAIVAIIWAGVVLVQLFWPGTAADGLTQDQVATWVIAAASVVGPVAVYAFPNTEKRG